MKVSCSSLLVLALSCAASSASWTDGDTAPTDGNIAPNSSVLFRRLRRSIMCTSGAIKIDLNCYGYNICVNGAWLPKRCPTGMIFSNNQCRFFWEATCDPQTCVPGTNKDYLHDCTKYYHCDDNYNQVLTSCPSGVRPFFAYHFNPSSLQCETALYWSKCPSPPSYLATHSQ